MAVAEAVMPPITSFPSVKAMDNVSRSFTLKLHFAFCYCFCGAYFAK